MYNTADIMQPEPDKPSSNQIVPSIIKTKTIHKEITLLCVLGCNYEERIKQQNIKLILDISTKKNYKNLQTDIEPVIKDVVSHQQPFLIEYLCYTLATALMRQFAFIEGLSLTIQKPQALAYAQHAYATIKVQRGVLHHGLVKDTH